MALSASDWNAIKWYMKEFGLSIRDMMKGPVVVFRDKNNDPVEANIASIKDKYRGRAKGTKKKKGVAA